MTPLERHHSLVMCSDCKEWTTYGEPCCGKTECDTDCPICGDDVAASTYDHADRMKSEGA